MTDPTIREATVEDVGDVRAIATGAWPETYAGLLSPLTIETALEEWYGPATVERRIEDAESRFLLAVDDEVAVGFASAGPPGADVGEPGVGTGSTTGGSDAAEGADGEAGDAAADADGPVDVAELRAIYVTPARQREGVGSALLEALEAGVREDGNDLLRARVHADNDRALAFYREHGFEVVDEREVELFGETAPEAVVEREL